jgi:myo-inositol 2-dehydrogenase / D-chiro-inositol 1-dehydrogenase
MSLRIGLVGAGFIGRLHGENLVRGLPGLRLALVADPSPAARDWAAGLGIPAVEAW